MENHDILSQIEHLGRTTLGPSDDPALAEWPELARLLTDRINPAGKMREPGRVSVTAAPACWRVTYHDMELGVIATVDVDRLASVWAELYRAIRGERPCQWAELRRGKAAQSRRRALEEEAARRQTRQ